MGFEFTIDGKPFAATPENSSVQIVLPQHLLDHILIIEWVEIDDIYQPQGKRMYRELFDNSGYDFNEIATELGSLSIPFVYHDEIPESYEDLYVENVMQSVDKEWEHYYSKG